jgi:O-antigen ligase
VKFRITQQLFFLLFFPLYFLFIIFGDSSWSFLIAATICTIFFAVREHLKFYKTPLSTGVAAVIVSTFAAQLLSVVMSVNIPHSAVQYFWYAFSGLCFLFFLFLDEKWISIDEIKEGLVLVGVALSCVVFLLLVFPQLGTIISPMSILAPTYGHSHTSIYLLLVAPLAWELYSTHKRSVINTASMLVISLALLTTFARLNIFLFFILLIGLGLLTLREKNIKFSKVLMLLLTASSAVVMLFFFTTFRHNFIPEQLCSIPVLQNKLCKPIHQEPRPMYWKQAVDGIVEKPWFGWGAGNVPVVSRKYKQEAYFFSSFSHNGYLQFLVEHGVVGAVPLFIMLGYAGYLALAQLWSLRSTGLKSQHFLSISILIFLVDGVFDFNWSFSSIWLLFTILFALLLKTQYVELKQKNKAISYSMVLIYNSLTLGIWLWLAAVLLSSLLWVAGNTSTSLRVFPFHVERVKVALEQEKLFALDKPFILELYASEPEIVHLQYRQATRFADRNEYYDRILALEPLNYKIRIEKIELFIRERKWQETLQEVLKFNVMFPTERALDTVPETYREILAQQVIEVANRLWYEDPELSAKFFIAIYNLYPWTLSHATIAPLENPGKFPAKNVHAVVDQMYAGWLWKYRETLAAWYFDQTGLALKEERWSDVQKNFEQTVQYDRTLRFPLWDISSVTLQKKYRSLYQQKQLAQIEEVLTTWKSIYQSSRPGNGEKNVSRQYRLGMATAFAEYSDMILPTDPLAADKAYQFTLELERGAVEE